MNKLNKFFRISFFAFAALLILAGCSADDASVPLAAANESAGSIENVAGLILSRDGKEIAFVEEAEVNGIVTVQMGRNSEVFEVKFVNENREIISVDEKYYTLAWKYEFFGIVTFEQPVGLNEWQFHIHGKKPGSSAFQLHLVNNKESEYFSPPIPLKVQ